MLVSPSRFACSRRAFGRRPLVWKAFSSRLRAASRKAWYAALVYLLYNLISFLSSSIGKHVAFISGMFTGDLGVTTAPQASATKTTRNDLHSLAAAQILDRLFHRLVCHSGSLFS